MGGKVNNKGKSRNIGCSLKEEEMKRGSRKSFRRKYKCKQCPRKKKEAPAKGESRTVCV